ncbi:hypothetical protein PF002_g29557 [Phytophthora fragariae]|uniref:Uncharacterized protein n=2 Tax=Phytophthora TaxID=4783 RepID=A0A6A3VX92_9STRA|nr:hypothetical protein PR002_g6703 [Phytophthora rubi]KAE9062607.1 hypothetical protein PF007_g29851 [Phytophthora fragariae]KAE9071184.1 hypothetical protein PF006_g29204 [Phytophthora fragariae]KAE9172475.1 hypothetical protein PF002_g29557 [Phytophthora fragariae]KAE9244517.1 hypothetical protein PF004_g5638 [Phytophthora fragariae]
MVAWSRLRASSISRIFCWTISICEANCRWKSAAQTAFSASTSDRCCCQRRSSSACATSCARRTASAWMASTFTGTSGTGAAPPSEGTCGVETRGAASSLTVDCAVFACIA